METRDNNRRKESIDGGNVSSDTDEDVEMDTFSEESSSTEASYSSDDSSELDTLCLEPMQEDLLKQCALYSTESRVRFDSMLKRSKKRLRNSSSSKDLRTEQPTKSSEESPTKGKTKAKKRRGRKAARILNTQLMNAVSRGDVEEVKRLLEAKANPNAVCHTRFISACHIAATHDNDMVSILLEGRAGRLMLDQYSRTPLHFAAWAGSLRPLLALLGFPADLQKKLQFGNITPEIEADIMRFAKSTNFDAMLGARSCPILNYSNYYSRKINMKLFKHALDNKDHCCENLTLPHMDYGWTPLHAAASSARALCCKVLLAAGADPFALNDDGLTPLAVVGANLHQQLPFGSIPIETSFTEVVNILASQKRMNYDEKCCTKKDIDNKASGALIENKWSQSFRNTALHAAAELQSSEDVVLLLQAGVSPMFTDKSGFTPLHICVQKRNKKLLQIFLDYLSDSGALKYAPRCGDGYSVLHYSVYMNWLDGVCVCLRSRATSSNSMEPAHNGETPLHTAASLENLDILREILRFAKSNNMINVKNGEGETALFKAIENGRTECVKMLLQEGASIKIISPTQYNVFHISAERGHVDILKVLLDHDEKYTRKNVNALTADCKAFAPIHFALENNHIECLNLLLSYNASISLKTGNRSTLLHIAASKNNMEFAKRILMSQPSQIYNVDDLGWSPLHTATCIRARDLTKLLILEGADLSARTTGPKKNHMTPLELIMNNISKPTEFLESIFDMCICTQRSKHVQDGGWFDPHGNLSFQDPDLEVIVDYGILLPKSGTPNRYVELKVIDALLETGDNSGQKRLLIHPLVESLICLKWKALVPFFYVILFIYGLFALALTIFVMTEFGYKDSDKTNPSYQDTALWTNALYFTIVVVLLQEVIFFTVNLMHYVKGVMQIETWLKFASIILAIILPKLMEKNISFPEDTVDWARHTATMAILTCWLYMVFLLSRFPNWGCYVLMFRKVFSNVVKILLTFGCLVFGFALCFMIQFRHQKSFDTLWNALVKTMTMMTSEFDYDDLIENKDTPQLQELGIIRIFFLIYVVLVAIVLMNLMVGVSVNDLNNLEVLGRIMQLEKQVQLVNNICSSLETFFFKRIFIKLLPKNWLTFPDKLIFKPYEPEWNNERAIPVHVRDAIFKKAVAQEKNEDQQISFESLTKQLNEVRELINSEKLRRSLNRRGERRGRGGANAVVRAAMRARCLAARRRSPHLYKPRHKKHDYQIGFEAHRKQRDDFNEKRKVNVDSDQMPTSLNKNEHVINMLNTSL